MRKTLPIILIFVLCGLAFGRETENKATTNCRGGGVMIGKAISLPKPVFLQGGRYKPLTNTIIVSVTIDENGNVIEANAIAGHPLFRQSSVQAARLSKFTPSYVGCEKTKSFTEIPSTFDGLKGTVKVKKPILRQTKFLEKSNRSKNLGIINASAISLPKPIYPQEAKDFCVGGKVEVEVLVDENGNVIEAKVISGDELLRQSSLDAVKKAKFQIRADSKGSKIRGVVVYNFKSKRKCLAIDEIVNKRTIFKPKMVLTNDQLNL